MESVLSLEDVIKSLVRSQVVLSDRTNMGVTLQDQGKLEEAIEAYKKALSLKPDYAEAHYNLSFALLNSSRLKEGLDKYEWRWKKSKNLLKMPHFSQPLWDGEKSLKGKRILLWSERFKMKFFLRFRLCLHQCYLHHFDSKNSHYTEKLCLLLLLNGFFLFPLTYDFSKSRLNFA